MDDKKKHSCHARHLQAGDCADERVLATATANRRRRRAAAVQPLGVTTRTMEPRVHVTGTSPPPGPAEPGMAADWPLTLVARQQKPFLLGSWPVSPSAGSMDRSISWSWTCLAANWPADKPASHIIRCYEERACQQRSLLAPRRCYICCHDISRRLEAPHPSNQSAGKGSELLLLAGSLILLLLPSPITTDHLPVPWFHLARPRRAIENSAACVVSDPLDPVGALEGGDEPAGDIRKDLVVVLVRRANIYIYIYIYSKSPVHLFLRCAYANLNGVCMHTMPVRHIQNLRTERSPSRVSASI
jgi:hypothetical protein